MYLCILLISTDALAAEFLGGKGSFKVVKKKKKAIVQLNCSII